jgi:hypothetical protein
VLQGTFLAELPPQLSASIISISAHGSLILTLDDPSGALPPPSENWASIFGEKIDKS